MPDDLLVAEELLGLLHLLALLDCMALLAFTLKLGVKAREAILATAFDLEADAARVHYGSDHTHVDRARDSGARLIEGLVHSDLHVALGAASFLVTEQLHLSFLTFKFNNYNHRLEKRLLNAFRLLLILICYFQQLAEASK